MSNHAAASPTEGLYEKIGGRQGVFRLVQRFYEGVLSDPQLAHFFKHTSMDRLQNMQAEFFIAALDGPVHYSPTAISHAHQGLGIQLPDFQRFVKHLFDSLEEFQLSDNERYEIVTHVSKYVNEVTGAPGGV